jgi:YtoQ family protein
MKWKVYLSGEIHTDWRNEIKQGCKDLGLNAEFFSANTNHEASDSAGDHLGIEESGFWRDHKSAKINSIRTQNLIKKCDIAIIRFGDKYKQWNAAFDAGYCAASNVPYLTLHADEIIHPLKEVNSLALARTTTTQQVIEILKYTINSE